MVRGTKGGKNGGNGRKKTKEREALPKGGVYC